eukprot:TRINITY_DN91878_c0_g1_i1.p1 TRINITY_DN91878_c0_g1~~TRINITY_DN91878_c0_g1_i1.p1  ORF type:complete len:407 (+),score=83.96 TRINITY_DN91878_c0_g1_i1:66-1286(+)
MTAATCEANPWGAIGPPGVDAAAPCTGVVEDYQLALSELSGFRDAFSRLMDRLHSRVVEDMRMMQAHKARMAAEATALEEKRCQLEVDAKRQAAVDAEAKARREEGDKRSGSRDSLAGPLAVGLQDTTVRAQSATAQPAPPPGAWTAIPPPSDVQLRKGRRGSAPAALSDSKSACGTQGQPAVQVQQALMPGGLSTSGATKTLLATTPAVAATSSVGPEQLSVPIQISRSPPCKPRVEKLPLRPQQQGRQSGRNGDATAGFNAGESHAPRPMPPHGRVESPAESVDSLWLLTTPPTASPGRSLATLDADALDGEHSPLKRPPGLESPTSKRTRGAAGHNALKQDEAARAKLSSFDLAAPLLALRAATRLAPEVPSRPSRSSAEGVGQIIGLRAADSEKPSTDTDRH